MRIPRGPFYVPLELSINLLSCPHRARDASLFAFSSVFLVWPVRQPKISFA